MKRDLAGRSVMITAGPTVEPIDPVRYISNHSLAETGYALAPRCGSSRSRRDALFRDPFAARPQGVHMVR